MMALIYLIMIPQFISTGLDHEMWGFYPHKLINRHAIFTLPPSMVQFYKHYIHFISQEAVKADHRRYAVPQEGARHYIDLDYYGLEVSRNWNELVLNYPKDSIESHGILPWHLLIVKSQLTRAFKETNIKQILRISADAGHYLADAHVPLHTTSNYNGQFTGQYGIHGFWETRIPELFIKNFDLWVGPASYQHDWYTSVWGIILGSHLAVDSVLGQERILTETFPEDQKYSYEVRLSRMVKVYSLEFSESYHLGLNRQVEHRLRAAISAVGDFWYTCWVDAGQPALTQLIGDHMMHSADYQQIGDSIWRKQHAPR